MVKLGDLYTEFSRIDLDTRGGYARVAQVKTNSNLKYPGYCAFKLMRHEINTQNGLNRFEDELQLLSAMTRDTNAPSSITKIYDSGFVQSTLSKSLHNRERVIPDLEIIPTGTSIDDFRDAKEKLKKNRSGDWLPYLLVELAPYDNSLLRQIHSQPKEDPSGLFRLPTGEVITMAFQLLDVMNYLHEYHSRAYIDWKPEHIFWNGLNKQVKLVDWNVTTHLDEDPGRAQNIRDELRLFCGTVLYIGLTFIDPENPTTSIGPRPTTDLNSPVPEIRRRYWTDKPEFHQRDLALDENIKEIIRTGLDPKRGFKNVEKLKGALFEYAQSELGATYDELYLKQQPSSPYFKSLAELRAAQKLLLNAQDYLLEAVATHGQTLEYIRLFDAIKRSLMNFPPA